MKLTLLGITFFVFFFSLDFHVLWCSMLSIFLLTEVKWQWATFVLGMGDHLSSRPAVKCV